MKNFKDQLDKKKWFDDRVNECLSSYYMPDYSMNICVDIGANVGAFPIAFKEKFKKFYCFEPIKQTYITLCENTNKNNINCENFNLAVTNITDDKIKIYMHESELSGDCNYFVENENYELCETICFNDIRKIVKNNIDYLKIDCEGAEFFILKDNNFIDVNFISFELHRGYLNNEQIHKIFDNLNKYFIIYEINKYNYFGYNKNLIDYER